MLAKHFLRGFATEQRKDIQEFSSWAMRLLLELERRIIGELSLGRNYKSAPGNMHAFWGQPNKIRNTAFFLNF